MDYIMEDTKKGSYYKIQTLQPKPSYGLSGKKRVQISPIYAMTLRGTYNPQIFMQVLADA